MIRDICRDESFLAQKAEPAAADDLGTAQDLLDTLSAHRDGCVGMAANMGFFCSKSNCPTFAGAPSAMIFPPSITTARSA